MKLNKFQSITVLIIFIWLVLFILLPNLLVVVTSFLTENRESQYFVELPLTIDAYKKLNESYLTVFLNSLYLSGIATVLCLVVGYPFALFISKVSPKFRAVLLFLVVLPFWVNSLVRIYAMKLFLGAKGFFNSFLLSLGIIGEPLRLINTEIAVIIGLMYLLLPFMILPLYSSISKFDPKLLEAARDLGANAWVRFWRLMIPLTMPGIVSGCLLVFLPAMGMFYVSDVLGGSQTPLLGNIIKSLFLNTSQFAVGSAVSVVLIILMAILMFVYYRVNKLLNKKVEFAQ